MDFFIRRSIACVLVLMVCLLITPLTEAFGPTSFGVINGTPATPSSVSSTSQNNQPAAVSLIAEYASFEKLAAGGDAVAARQLSADIRRCEHIQSVQQFLNTWRKDRAYKGASAAELKDAMPVAFASEKDALARDLKGLCAGYDSEMADGRAYVVLLQAANLGDWDSAECYVATDYSFVPGKYKATDPLAYRANAWRLLDDAIRHGQWGVVRAAFRGMTLSWVDWYPLSASLRGDPVMAYRLARLLRMGAKAGSPDARYLDLAVDSSGRKITQAQRIQADDWAKATLERYYSKSGPSTPFTTACDHQPIGFQTL